MHTNSSKVHHWDGGGGFETDQDEIKPTSEPVCQHWSGHRSVHTNSSKVHHWDGGGGFETDQCRTLVFKAANSFHRVIISKNVVI